MGLGKGSWGNGGYWQSSQLWGVCLCLLLTLGRPAPRGQNWAASKQGCWKKGGTICLWFNSYFK